MRNIFLEQSYTKCGGKASPRSVCTKFLDQHPEML